MTDPLSESLTNIATSFPSTITARAYDVAWDGSTIIYLLGFVLAVYLLILLVGQLMYPPYYGPAPPFFMARETFEPQSDFQQKPYTFGWSPFSGRMMGTPLGDLTQRVLRATEQNHET